MDTPSQNAGPDRDPDGARRRIDDLDARLKKARGTDGAPKQDMRVSHRETGVAYRVLVDMIAGLSVGGFFGYWLDRWMGWTPYALVVGLLVGGFFRMGFECGVLRRQRCLDNKYRPIASSRQSQRILAMKFPDCRCLRHQ